MGRKGNILKTFIKRIFDYLTFFSKIMACLLQKIAFFDGFEPPRTSSGLKHFMPRLMSRLFATPFILKTPYIGELIVALIIQFPK